MMRAGFYEERGQASVEYAAIGAALIIIAVALGSLWHFGAEGGFQHLAQVHASHVLAAEGGVLDVLLY